MHIFVSFLSEEDSVDSQSSSSSNKKQDPADSVVADVDIQYSSADEDEYESEDEETEKSNDDELGDNKRTFEDSFDDGSDTELDNDKTSMDDTLTYIRSLIDRTRKFIKFTRRCCHMHDHLKEEAEKRKLKGHGLILDCIIRWNSSYYMLERFINYQDLINQITINPRLIPASLQPN